jgi:hypothetical protein
MVSVISGDIINSRTTTPGRWLRLLKKTLLSWGESPAQWEIYRGDSFQLEVKEASKALAIAIQIKAGIKSDKGLDIRLAIGLGDKKYHAKRISESNGSAFIYSGELVEEMKRLGVTMAVRSGHEAFDKEINLYLALASFIMDGWSDRVAATVYATMRNPGKSQEALGKMLKVKQNAVSMRLKRARFNDIMEMIRLYEEKVKKLKS